MKILIVKIGAIGDVVMALPILPYLRKRYPTAQITWICGRQVASLIAATGLVDRIIEVDEKALFKGSFLSRFGAVFRIWKQIGGRAYDLCVTGHVDPRYRFLSWPIRCKKRCFWDRKAKRIRPVPGRYHAEEYVRLVSEIDGPETPPVVFPQLIVPFFPFIPRGIEKLGIGQGGSPDFLAGMSGSARAHDTSDGRKRWGKADAGQNQFFSHDGYKDSFIVVAPGGAKNILSESALRRWPIESYAELIQKLSDRSIPVVVTGGPDDEWVKNHFKDLVYVDLIGRLDLLETVALFKQCRLVITHDSGPLHLAKLADCPTIALFGPTNPREKVGRSEKIRVLWGGEHLSCRPCYDGKTYAPCQRNACLRTISPDKVLELITGGIEKLEFGPGGSPEFFVWSEQPCREARRE